MIRRSTERLATAANERGAAAPSLVDLSWRTDVAISTDAVARLMQPSLLVGLLFRLFDRRERAS